MDQVLKQASDKARAQGVEEPRDEKTPAQKREEVLQFVVKEPFAQGAGAAVEEARLLSADDWGFRLEDVDYDPVHIWHGVNDTNAPITMMRYMADKVPNAVLHELEGDTHYTMTRHLEAALGELVPKDTN
jgi:pimeloyl-ACP methyl ester carboxylesterase